MCAGSNGCHGNRNQLSPILAIRGAHHADDSILKFGAGFKETTQGGGVASTRIFNAGKSYRFLYKVHGAEDADWEGVTLGPTVHNEYKGGSFHQGGRITAWGDISTISEFCAECHGNFPCRRLSSEWIGSASPWLRHPTDVVLPAAVNILLIPHIALRRRLPDKTLLTVQHRHQEL